MESLEECMQAYKRIKAEADILLPLYDPLAADRLKAELKGKLRSLGKEELHD